MKRNTLFFFLTCLLISRAAEAQLFGSGIVFDPTQSAHAITQIEQESQSLENQAQQIENGQQMFTTTVKIWTTAVETYNTVQQQYNLYRQMMTSPQLLYARFLSPMTDLRTLEQLSNTYNNSAGWINSANTGNGAAAAYNQVSVPRTSSVIPGYGNASLSGQEQIAAQGATVDLGDSVMTNNLAVLGAIRAHQTSRQSDIANLEAASHSQDPGEQTVMAELQRINQALLLELRSMQDANQINANRALAESIAQKQQQDALKAGFQDSSSFVTNYQSQVAPAYGGGAQALSY